MKARIITFVCVLTAVGVLAVRRQARLRSISASIPADTQPQRVIAPPTSEPASVTVAWLPAGPDEHRLISVLLLEHQVFATTDRGIYRASLSERKWLVASPLPMPPGGQFAAERMDAKVLYYSMRWRAKSETAHGVWRSRDHGTSWGRVSDQDDIWSMLLLPNGVLYAATAYRVLMSKNEGWDWEDITHNGAGRPEGLTEDPDHDGLVLVSADGGLRRLEWVAKNNHYDWQIRLGHGMTGGRMTPEFFMNRFGASTWEIFGAEATLATYFADQYRNSGEVFGLNIIADQARYDFALKDKKKIEINVRFLSKEGSVKLVDFDDPRNCWALLLLSLAHDGLPQRYQHAARNSDSVARKLITVDHAHPYSKSIDLDAIGVFDRPGRYMAKVTYMSEGVADKTREEWPGYFQGADFEVDIR